ncbi:MAG: hypothetical protein K2O47_07905 [Muribaculaceae bacterium]|nr:hypothetical protein [Muribaculaceae bacterium]
MKILIADAGATKTDWVKLSLNGVSEIKEEEYTGIGISPLHHDTDMIEEELRLVRAALGESFDKIRFFGTGIGSPVIAGKMETILSEMFSCRDIKADSDMAGAAGALLGGSPGIACIMGTGSNSCHYDGSAIDRKSVSLGYLLDDEGGGVAFARCLLSDVYKKIAPDDIIAKFNSKYDLSVSEVVDHLYRKPSPNRWIASFMPFITENLSHPYIMGLVRSQIDLFFDREFASYSEKELKEEGIGFAGSVAGELADSIADAMHARNWKLRAVIRKPLPGLVNQFKQVK